LGYSDKEQCLNNCSIFHIIDSAEKQQLIEKLKNQMSIESFEVFIRANGKLIWVEINADYFPNLGLVKGQMRDVSITKLLTVTEKQILKFVMQGKSNSEIACDAKRSTRTIECHRAKIMKKLGVSNVVELAKKALFSK
jgi:DNA-binding NarL/FixJ family response regulator